MVTKLLRGGEVAQILSVSKAHAYQLMAAGKIPTVHLGRSVRVRPEDLEKYLETSIAQSDEMVFPT